MAWGGEVSAEHQLVTGVPHGSVLGPSSSPLHYITGSHHTSTWFLLPFLRWWHTAVSLNSTWWSNGSCTDLRLPGEHLCMDERTSSTAQPGKDWASCLPCNSPTLLHDFTIQLGSSTITLSSSVRNLGVFSMTSWLSKTTLQKLLDLAGLHYSHQKDQALSNGACCTNYFVISRLDYCNALLAGLP